MINIAHNKVFISRICIIKKCFDHRQAKMSNKYKKIILHLNSIIINSKIVILSIQIIKLKIDSHRTNLAKIIKSIMNLFSQPKIQIKIQLTFSF